MRRTDLSESPLTSDGARALPFLSSKMKFSYQFRSKNLSEKNAGIELLGPNSRIAALAFKTQDICTGNPVASPGCPEIEGLFFSSGISPRDVRFVQLDIPKLTVGVQDSGAEEDRGCGLRTRNPSRCTRILGNSGERTAVPVVLVVLFISPLGRMGEAQRRSHQFARAEKSWLCRKCREGWSGDSENTSQTIVLVYCSRTIGSRPSYRIKAVSCICMY